MFFQSNFERSEKEALSILIRQLWTKIPETGDKGDNKKNIASFEKKNRIFFSFTHNTDNRIDVAVSYLLNKHFLSFAIRWEK